MTTSTRVLAVAFVAVVAAFIGSSVLVHRSARVIDADARRIARDVAPDIQVVSDLRSEIRELQARVTGTIDGRSTPDDVAETRKRVDKLLEAAVALPTDPPEAILLGKLHSAIRAFDEAAERALEQVRGGHPEQARETLRTEVRLRGDVAGQAGHELVSYNVQAAEDAAQRIEAARARANRFGWQLDGFCALIALLAASVTVRVTRHVQRVQQENHRLLQRKAEELEQFAGRVAHDILSPLSAVNMALGVAERSPAQAPDTLERARSSLSRVRRIVDGLLEFARAGARPEAGSRAEVRPVAAGLLEELGPFAAQRHASLRVGEVADCTVACSPGVLLSCSATCCATGSSTSATRSSAKCSCASGSAAGAWSSRWKTPGQGSPPRWARGSSNRTSGDPTPQPPASGSVSRRSSGWWSRTADRSASASETAAAPCSGSSWTRRLPPKRRRGSPACAALDVVASRRWPRALPGQRRASRAMPATLARSHRKDPYRCSAKRRRAPQAACRRWSPPFATHSARPERSAAPGCSWR
jgi:signal transduction histidine kinase